MFVFCEGHLPVSLAFSFMPLQAVNRFAFGTQKFSAEDVIARLHPTYGGEEALQETQKMLFEEVLKPILRDWASKDTDSDGKSQLHRFLKFCTGQWYLPHPSQPFKIEVLFEEKESEDWLPEAHTCHNMLSFPLTAYNANQEILEQNLGQAVAQCDLFVMH